jgi:hypothetical protein
MTGDQDVRRDLAGPQHPLDVGPDRPGRIEDRRVRESSFVEAHPLGEAMPQIVIG